MGKSRLGGANGWARDDGGGSSFCVCRCRDLYSYDTLSE